MSNSPPPIPAAPQPDAVDLVPYAHMGWTPMGKARVKGPSGNLGRWFLIAPAWMFVGATMIGAAGAAVGAVFSLRGVVGGAFFGSGFFLMMAVVASVRAARRSRELAVLGYVEQAVRLNLPLPAMLRAAERAERPSIGRALAAVRGRLEEGYPLSDALWLMPGGMPPATLARIEAGETNNKLAPALARVVDAERGRPTQSDSTGGFMVRWYLITYTFCIAGGISLVAIFVLPKYRQIYLDFGLRLPAITQWVMESWDVISMIVFPVACILLLIEVGRIGGAMISPRLMRLRPFDWLTDRLAWYTPLLAGLTRAGAYAALCHHLADAMESGRPTTGAVVNTLSMRTNRVLMKQTRRWATGVGEGRPPAEAADAAGLPPVIVGMIASARTQESLVKSLRFLGEYFDSRALRSGDSLRAAIIPVIALIAGLIVGSLAVGLMLPMSELADGVMKSTTHRGPM